jgi:hypothetical protein
MPPTKSTCLDTTMREVASAAIDGTRRAIWYSSKWKTYYYAETSEPLTKAQKNNPWLWDYLPRTFAITNVYPKFRSAWMTKANRHVSGFEKEPDLFYQPDRADTLLHSSYISDLTSREIRNCEFLQQFPHPNVCYYHGVRVDYRGLARALVFDRYDMTLKDMVDKVGDINTAACLRDIESGLRHLHSLGVVHCDLKPPNIFVDLDSKRFVIGDFDSLHKQGEEIDLKGGTRGWTLDDNIARCENDWFSLAMIRAWLEKKMVPGLRTCTKEDNEEFRTGRIIGKAIQKFKEDPHAFVPAELLSVDEDAMDTSATPAAFR